jgi:hypothetical protein
MFNFAGTQRVLSSGHPFEKTDIKTSLPEADSSHFVFNLRASDISCLTSKLKLSKHPSAQVKCVVNALKKVATRRIHIVKM